MVFSKAHGWALKEYPDADRVAAAAMTPCRERISLIFIVYQSNNEKSFSILSCLPDNQIIESPSMLLVI